MFSAYRVLLNISVINTLSCSHLQHMGHAYQAMKNITWIVTSFSFTQSKSLNIFAAHASKTWSTYHMMPKWKRVGKQCTHCLIWFNKTLKNIKRLMTKNAHFLFSTWGGVGWGDQELTESNEEAIIYYNAQGVHQSFADGIIVLSTEWSLLQTLNNHRFPSVW